ncbi:tripartite tricarboxylate transporter substrate binding protein [Pararhodobacter sp. CCB-MM2]|uniref:Bug family tripartite tricarboxylate transporter substrate binding protein n=1 Tax=Pararhodobacter sp. CCB-MM2 TaxID=1786003 RepID=UPI000836CFEA|nr:tripartite tricarboxylate transporter substrate binding protein [Pararhodobacter sp. CCB-MM2]
MRTIVFGAMTALAFGATAVSAQDYPSREIQGIIQWGAGGSTDTVMRSVTPHAEEVLGGTVVMQNMTGAVGAIALNYVADAEADGYTVLMGAENPMLYRTMGLGERDYSEFVPINLLARGTPILVAGPDAPYSTYAELMAYIAEHPGEVRFGSTGPGGLPSVITAMMQSVEGELDVIFVPYDGDGPALTALQGGAIDVMPAVLGAAIENIRAGTMKPLAIFDTERNERLPDVATAVEGNEGYSTYLPWGPFFGVFVHEGTPDEAVTALTAAYAQAAEAEDFRALMDTRGFTMMNISGDEAREFLAAWQSTTAWLMQEAGLAVNNPADLGIPRPGE